MVVKKKGRTLWLRERLGPDTIEVWLVKNLKDEGLPMHGLWHEDTNTIEINATDSPPDQLSTLLHERIHAVSDKYGLELDEQCVRTLEKGLIQMERTSKHVKGTE